VRSTLRRWGTLYVTFKPSSRAGAPCRVERGRISSTVKLATSERFFGTIVKHAGDGRMVEQTNTCSSESGGQGWEFDASRAVGRGRHVGLSASPATRRSTRLSVEYWYANSNVTVTNQLTLTGFPAKNGSPGTAWPAHTAGLSDFSRSFIEGLPP
jgi:hypothetical protein